MSRAQRSAYRAHWVECVYNLQAADVGYKWHGMDSIPHVLCWALTVCCYSVPMNELACMQHGCFSHMMYVLRDTLPMQQ